MTCPTATYTQAATPDSSPPTWSALITLKSSAATAWAADTTSPPRIKVDVSYSLATTGQTIYGIGIDPNSSGVLFDVKFTTPFVVPNGTFAGTLTFKVTWSRTLTNS